MRVCTIILPVAMIAILSSVAFAQVHPMDPRLPRGSVSSQESYQSAAKLKTLERSYNVAKAAYGRKPQKADLKKKYIEATVVFGHESMVSPALPAKLKYRQALRLYREVLKLDPNNPVARPESDMIIAIYKQMGRPVPQ